MSDLFSGLPRTKRGLVDHALWIVVERLRPQSLFHLKLLKERPHLRDGGFIIEFYDTSDMEAELIHAMIEIFSSRAFVQEYETEDIGCGVMVSATNIRVVTSCEGFMRFLVEEVSALPARVHAFAIDRASFDESGLFDRIKHLNYVIRPGVMEDHDKALISLPDADEASLVRMWAR